LLVFKRRRASVGVRVKRFLAKGALRHTHWSGRRFSTFVIENDLQKQQFATVTMNMLLLHAARAASFRQMAQKSGAVRLFSVIPLPDEIAVTNFRKLNAKSVLYFTATWCFPCREVKPVYEAMATEYADYVAFGKIDVDENSDSLAEFNVSSVSCPRTKS
jgi:thioredoxin 1